jgi:hypothetical protein
MAAGQGSRLMASAYAGAIIAGTGPAKSASADPMRPRYFSVMLMVNTRECDGRHSTQPMGCALMTESGHDEHPDVRQRLA